MSQEVEIALGVLLVIERLGQVAGNFVQFPAIYFRLIVGLLRFIELVSRDQRPGWR